MRSPAVILVVVGAVAFVTVGGLRAARQPARALSRAQFVSAADGACYRAAEGFSPTRLDKPYTTSLRANLPVFERLRSALSDVVPPQEDAASFELMLSTLDTSLRADRDLLRFSATDQLRFGQAAIRQEKTWDRLRALSAKLDLGWCRWVWTWHPRTPVP